MSPSQAAEQVIAAVVAMASQGKPLMQRVLPPANVQFWAHYPDDDARDAVTRSRWYYHVHEAGDRDPAEHGHFHLFLHRSQFAASAQPLAAPIEGDAAPAHVVHIAGLSIDHSGLPISWFATNRWVTDEFLYAAEDLAAHIALYDVSNTGEEELVDSFLTAMVALYRDELIDLLHERDRRIKELLAANGPAALESGHEVLAMRAIDLDAKIESVTGPG